MNNEINFYDLEKFLKRKKEINDDYQGMTINDYINYFISRTNQIFKYDGLPDTIPSEILEQMIQLGGVVCITKVDDKLYAFNGGWGGVLDEYYMPKQFTVANPYLRFNKTINLGEDGCIIRNDIRVVGLLPIFRKYAQMLYENDISLRVAGINLRLTNVFSAGDDKTYQSAKNFIKSVYDGKLNVIQESQLLDGLKVHSGSNGVNSNYISQLVELRQYNLGQFYAEIGLQMNYNMKRESLSESETTMDLFALEPLISHMLKIRKMDIEKVNNMFGTNITVELNSAWEKEFADHDSYIEGDITNEEKEKENEKEKEKEGGEENE